VRTCIVKDSATETLPH